MSVQIVSGISVTGAHGNYASIANIKSLKSLVTIAYLIFMCSLAGPKKIGGGGGRVEGRGWGVYLHVQTSFQ